MGRVDQHARTSDEALIRGSLHGSPEAFGTFYDRYERAVFVFMARRCSDAETAADLTAETFAAALEGRQRFEGRAGAPAVAWLFGIARNVLAESHRRRRVARDARARMQVHHATAAQATIDALQVLIDREDGLEALLHLDNLPPAHAAAIRAYVIDERSYPDLAADLNVSDATVRQHVSRGLAALRRKVTQP